MEGEPDQSSEKSERNQQLAKLVLLGALGCFLFAHAFLSRRGPDTLELRRPAEHQFDFKLDLNQASVVELMQLPGVGQTLAQRIVDDRTRNGNFAAVDDLKRVKGIGPKLVDRIRPYAFGVETTDRKHVSE